MSTCWELPSRDIWDGASGHTDINKRKKQEVRLGDQLSLMILFRKEDYLRMKRKIEFLMFIINEYFQFHLILKENNTL